MTHELKIWPVYYRRVAEGSKTFEVRENDRDFQAGDDVILYEWDPKEERGVGSPQLKFKIGYVLPLVGTTKVVFSLIIPKAKQ